MEIGGMGAHGMLSDYHDELKPFLHVIRKHGTANERLGQQRQRAACHVLCASTIRLNDQALAGEGKNHLLSY